MQTIFPANIASISCTPNVAGPPVWGTVCRYTCLPGYEMSGGDTRTCENVGGTGVWVPTNDVQCVETVCTAILAPQHGTVACTDGNKYRSVCRVECEAGYFPEDQDRISAMCQANSNWDVELTTCKDILPPIFVSCPTDIVAFADRNRETTHVTWEEPTAIDKININLNVPAHVQLTEGSPPGSTFTRGQHLIKYTATDASTNEALCSFKIDVQVITCPPIRYTIKAELSCPSGYVYGSTCSFGCQIGYPVVGPTSFSCERDYTSSEPVGYWDWGGDGTQPFCKIVPCPTLRPPDNGALACDGWAEGTFCIIQCNENWDVPIDAPPRYVCETLSGTWNPDDDVPNCALPRDPDSMNLPSELYYYSGDCRDPETQAQIQANFIAILNSSDYSDICRLFVECAAENVQVICGNVTTRSLQPSFQLRVTFDLTVKVNAQTDDHTSYLDVEDTLFSMAYKIDEGVKGGKFSLNNVTTIDLEVEPESFATSNWTNLVCETGYQPNYVDYTCQGCPKGTYLDTDKGTCEKCEVGQFQDEYGQLACKPCPPETWTVKNGSQAVDLCLDNCQAGWYSDTGMEPCAQCEMGHYQPTTGQRQCQRCPHGKTTTTFGAKAMNECVGIDLVLNASSRVQLTKTHSDLRGITLSFWIRPHVDSPHGSIFHLKRESDTLFAVGNPGSLEVALTSTVLRTGISLDDGKWHNLAVTLRHLENDCKVYVDGAESWSRRLPSNAHTVFPVNTDIVLGDAGGDYNDCDSNPCGEHANGCQDNFGSYSCVCEVGYTGTHCEVNINDCHEGSFNGEWGEWTDWTPCSATCGNGTHQRWRQCNNPPPEEDGKNCTGRNTESGSCSLKDCPSCMELKRSYGVIMDCYWNATEDRNYCQIDCTPGLEFSETPHPLYTCGAESEYKWNHQTENNPLAILPSCAHGQIPSKLSLDYELKYPDLYCQSPEDSLGVVEAIRDIGSLNVQDIDCVKRTTCNVTLEVHHCDTLAKNKSPASLSITLWGEINGTLNSEVVAVNGNITDEGHEAVNSLSRTIIDLVSAAEVIKNKSKFDNFAVIIDGQSFAVDANGSEPMLIAECQPGMVAQKMVCVYCAPGSYYRNRMCIKCPKGSFQELEGQMSCISCPEGFTTAGLGSNNHSNCYVAPEIPTEEAVVTITQGLTTMISASLDPNNSGAPTGLIGLIHNLRRTNYFSTPKAQPINLMTMASLCNRYKDSKRCKRRTRKD
ncbi:sushi, von Willebrand factor type A, EGF and pentraxin domain-containing protein 1-like [Branchiostoma floridae]|uniref:Sushi, von Willebrand factor type A, EGF and pentraxin domain-containing protein 1-like n=1 Tax=Branchiostoma floridae TaxID=7739 RepID=A0A9J7HRF0_BRAFL|nr:sushi, von Willebrand factor type A, EGF and pentraxin domain-containing protein 1-like [Branchiostoma floridae]